MHKSLMGLDKNVHVLEKCPDKLSSFKTLVAFRIVRIELSEI